MHHFRLVKSRFFLNYFAGYICVALLGLGTGCTDSGSDGNGDTDDSDTDSVTTGGLESDSDTSTHSQTDEDSDSGTGPESSPDTEASTDTAIDTAMDTTSDTAMDTSADSLVDTIPDTETATAYDSDSDTADTNADTDTGSDVEPACVVRVKVDGNDDNTGESWDNAMASLNMAMTLASESEPTCEVWVKQGTYYPDNPENANRFSTFQLRANTAVYGGFKGDETARNQRNINENETILSGNIGQPGEDYFKVIHVVTAIGANGATLNGVTITGGNAGSHLCNAESTGYGGGFYNKSDDVTIEACRFISNVGCYGAGLHSSGARLNLIDTTFANQTLLSGGFGAGIFSSSGGSELRISGCHFTDNEGELGSAMGGGVYSVGVNTIIEDSTFSGNTARRGGGVYLFSGETTLKNCAFEENVAENGGGLYIASSCVAHIENTAFIGNTAESQGGGVSTWSESGQITGCRFEGNTAETGGGLYNRGAAALTNVVFVGNEAAQEGTGTGGAVHNEDSLTLTNCTLTGNSAVDGPEIFSADLDASVTINNTIVYASDTGDIVGGIYTASSSLFRFDMTGTDVITGDPLFVDAAAGDVRLCGGSPALNSAEATHSPTTDINGTPRDNTPNMGAFEGSVECEQ